MNINLKQLLKLTKTSILLSATLATAGVYGQTEEAGDDDIVDLEAFDIIGEAYAFGAQKIVTVSGDDIELFQMNDLSDLFSQYPSVQVGGGLPAAQKIYVRGIEDKLLNITIDGATQGGYMSHHHGQYVIEPDLLKLVSVEPGPGSASNGPGALAGVIRFETKSAEDFLRADQTSGSYLKGNYFSNASAVKFTGAVYGRLSEDVSALISYSWSDSDDYSDGNGNVVDYTGHTQSRAFLKLNGRIASNQGWAFSHETVSDEGTFRHRPNFSGYFNHPVAPNIPVDMDISRNTTVFSYFNELGDDLNTIKAKAYVSDFDIDREGQYSMGYKSFGLDLRNIAKYEDHTLEYGIDYRDDTATFTGGGSITGFAATLNYLTVPDETVEILGFFVQDDYQATEQLQITYGVRLDRYDYVDRNGLVFKDDGLSPNIGLSYNLAEGFDLNASYGRAFRGVTPLDVITANEGSMANDPNAEAETAENFELGFQYSTDIFFLNGTVYEQNIFDVLADRNQDNLRGNEGDMKVTGYDISAGIVSGGFTGSIGVSDSDPEFNGAPLGDSDLGLGVAYGRTWNVNTSYNLPEQRLNFGWNLNFVERYDNVPAGAPSKQSYAVHDLFLRWQPDEAGQWAVTLVLNNAFDKYYVNQATSGYNSRLGRVAGLAEAGFDARISTSFQF